MVSSNKPLQNIYNTYMFASIIIYGHFDHRMDIIIDIKKPLQNIYNTYMFAGIAIYGYSDHKMDITIEFISKNHFRRYITLICLPVLPYMVILITQWISPLNSNQKTTLEHI